MKLAPANSNESTFSVPLDVANIDPRAAGITVIVPCCNEVDSLPNLHAALAGLRGAFEGYGPLEFVLVDDGSTDETLPMMQKYFGADKDVTLIGHETNRGIAAAIATGLRHARTDVVATLDADCTYDPLSLAPMVDLLAADVDLVVASPYHPRGSVDGVVYWRLGLSRLASRLYSFVMRNKLHTYTSCVRVYRRNSVVDLPLRNAGFVGVVELLWQLDRRGGNIVEFPAVLRTRTTGCSKMRVFKTTLAHSRFLARAALLRPLGVFSNRVSDPGLARS